MTTEEQQGNSTMPELRKTLLHGSARTRIHVFVFFQEPVETWQITYQKSQVPQAELEKFLIKSIENYSCWQYWISTIDTLV